MEDALDQNLNLLNVETRCLLMGDPFVSLQSPKDEPCDASFPIRCVFCSIYVSLTLLHKVVNILSQCRVRVRILLTSTSARILGPCRILWYSPFWVFRVACVFVLILSRLVCHSNSLGIISMSSWKILQSLFP
jgi:hypothetical protein